MSFKNSTTGERNCLAKVFLALQDSYRAGDLCLEFVFNVLLTAFQDWARIPYIYFILVGRKKCNFIVFRTDLLFWSQQCTLYRRLSSNAHVLVKRCFKNKTVSIFFSFCTSHLHFLPDFPVRYSLFSSFRKIPILLLAFFFLYVSFLLFFDFLKGLSNQMNIFKAYTVHMRNWFLLKRKINVKFLIASLKTLTNSKEWSEIRIKFFSGFPSFS